MDLIFEPQRRWEPFTMEIGYFDTVLDIKKKVQRNKGIPTSQQTLIFDGQVLQDEYDVERCSFLHNSHVQLLIASDPDIKQAVTTKTIKVSVIIPSLSNVKVPVEIEADKCTTVLKLKEKLQQTDEVPAKHLALKNATGVGLQDHELINGNSEIYLEFKRSPPRSTGSARAGARVPRKLRVWVLTIGGKTKIPVEINADDNVVELRKALQKNFSFLEDYFFIHGNDVMEEDKSFRWHHVRDGQTIEMFPGYIISDSGS